MSKQTLKTIKPSKLLQFFDTKSLGKNEKGSITPRTIKDLSDAFGPLDVNAALMVCRKFVESGQMVDVGLANTLPIMGERFLAHNFSDDLAEYGMYDFMIEGFLSIRNHFEQSVLPIIVEKPIGDLDIGTGFVIHSGVILTALHCVKGMNNIKVLDHSGTPISIDKIIYSKDEKLDIAMLLPSANSLPAMNKLKLGEFQLLDEVLTMGFPPIPGFDAIQVSEISQIGSEIKSAKGNVVGEGVVYSDSQKYLLINARVKGGNSGSPLINKYGLVVGMIVQIPLDAQDNTKLDQLGYGVGIPYDSIVDFVNKGLTNDPSTEELPTKKTKTGIKTNI